MYRITVKDKHVDVTAFEFRELASLLDDRKVGDFGYIRIESINEQAADPTIPRGFLDWAENQGMLKKKPAVLLEMYERYCSELGYDWRVTALRSTPQAEQGGVSR